MPALCRPLLHLKVGFTYAWKHGGEAHMQNGNNELFYYSRKANCMGMQVPNCGLQIVFKYLKFTANQVQIIGRGFQMP